MMRPQLHFTPQSGWINDPHGITYRDGHYEVFFQYVPGQTIWGPNCHWGHATGPDLLSLTEAPVAIAPGDGDDGIWTGSLVVDNHGYARVFYTAITTPDFGVGRVRSATPIDERWEAWRKGDIVAEAPPGLDILAFRDPFVRREGDTWRMFVGAGLTDGTAMALSYTSRDLGSWAYGGVVLQRSTHETDPVWMGALWECPQIFELDGKAVMVSSVWDADVLHYAGYAIGTYANGTFNAESWGRLTYGNSYYAPSLFSDSTGRACLTFWMRGIGDADAGWEGAHSVPHVLSLHGNHLVATPHPDVDAHRANRAAPGAMNAIAVDIEWRPRGDDELVIRSAGVIIARADVTAESITVEAEGATTSFPTRGPIRVIVDGPILEISSSAGIAGFVITRESTDLTVSASSGSIDAHRLS